MKLVSSRLTQERTTKNRNSNNKRKNNITTTTKRSSRKTFALTSPFKSDSRSSSLHSLVQTTTFWNNKSIHKMLATAANNSNQFNSKQYNSFNSNKMYNNNFSNRREFMNNNNNKMIPNKNMHRQVIPVHHKKSNPIQIRSNNYQQQHHQPHSASFQNSELTVNLTNNEPRLVIFNHNHTTSNNLHPNNNNNNYRESKFFTSHFNNNNNNTLISSTNSNTKLFHHSKQNRQHQQNDPFGISNSVPCSAGFKRFNSRFKYVNHKSAQASSNPNATGSTKNSAPYNTTQYIMFDYSRRRLHDQECPNEQQSFTDEWNMALAAAAATSTSEDSNKQPEFLTRTSILNDNLNAFSLDENNKNQFSLSDHNLNLMEEEGEEDEPMIGEEEDYEINPDQRIQHLSSSL